MSDSQTIYSIVIDITYLNFKDILLKEDNNGDSQNFYNGRLIHFLSDLCSFSDIFPKKVHDNPIIIWKNIQRYVLMGDFLIQSLKFIFLSYNRQLTFHFKVKFVQKIYLIQLFFIPYICQYSYKLSLFFLFNGSFQTRTILRYQDFVLPIYYCLY